MRTLVIFVLLSCGILPSYANGNVVPQDSVKKVTVRITVSEKPRVMNFDSLLQSRQAVKPRVNRKAATQNQTTPSSRKVTNTFQASPDKKSTEKSLSRKKTVSKPTRTSTSSKTSKPGISTQAPDHHAEELEPVQVTDDKTSVETSDVKTSRTYLWVGFMLIVVGVILGILFGKTALLISIAGMVFVIIGYTI